MTRRIDPDVLALKQTVKALNGSTSYRMLRANLDFLWDCYGIGREKEQEELVAARREVERLTHIALDSNPEPAAQEAIRAAKRETIEACAKVADDYPRRDPGEDGNGYWAAEEIAAAIRAMTADLGEGEK